MGLTRSDIGGILLAVVVGVLCFWAWTGFVIVDPNNVGWLTRSNPDPLLYGLTWWFYRDGPWGWPLGYNPAFGIEFQTSIAITDTLPLVAIPLKALQPLLPPIQQYWGIWVMVCMLLQSIFGYLLARAMKAPIPVALVVCGFVCFGTPLLRQIVDHLTLAAQWIVLAALWLYAISPRRHWPWILLLFVASLVQPYLLAMAGVVWVASIVQRARLKHSQLGLVAEFGGGAVVALATMYSVGYFVTPSLDAWGLGIARLNLLSFFDPDGWSQFLSDIPTMEGEYEGFAYLGLGVLLLLVAVIVLLILKPVGRPSSVRWVPLYVFLLALTAFALSPVVGFGPLQWVVVDRLPLLIEKVWSAFRSTGRMIWPVYYFITVATVVYVGRSFRTPVAVAIVGVALVIQLFDTYPGWGQYREKRKDAYATTFSTTLVSPLWDAVPARYPRIREIPVWENGYHWFPISVMAATHRMSTDSVYGGRIDPRVWRDMDNKAQAAATKGEFDPGAIYVVNDALARWTARQARPGDLFGIVDGLLVFARGGADLIASTGTQFTPYDPAAPEMPVGRLYDFAANKDGIPFLTDQWRNYWRGGIIAAHQRAGIQFRAPSIGQGAVLRLTVKGNTRTTNPEVVGFSVNGADAGTLTIPYGETATYDIPLTSHPDGNYLVDLAISEAEGPGFLHPGNDSAPVGLVVFTMELLAAPN